MRRRSSRGFSLWQAIDDIFQTVARKPYFLGIDLGSAHVRLYLEDRGLVLREKTYVVQNQKTHDFVVFGDEAYDMLGKTPSNLSVFAPITEGRVSDFDGIVYLLKSLVERALSPYKQYSILNNFHVIFNVPLGLTEVEEMAIVEVGKKIGAREVFLVETPLAGGFGLRLPVMENTGTFLVDMGGGTTEISVVSLGGVVSYKVLRLGGRDFSEAISNYIRLRYGLMIGEKTSEEIKVSLGSLLQGSTHQLEISGRSVETGMPKTIHIKANLLYEALYPYFGQLVEAIKSIIEETPPELLKDIQQKGIVMSGMSSHFTDLDEYLKKEIGLPVGVEKEPGLSVIRGLGWLIEHPDVMRKIAVTFSRI